ncbi:MAG: HAD family phosphatase [Alistipes sp.]|jgi:2-haloacid dehalogenase|nr:HAD family phosphatase [Alistipes sp.]
MIKNVVFDFGRVLIDWDPRNLFRKVFESEEEMEYFLANVCTQEWNNLQDSERTYAEGIAELVPKFPQYEREINIYFDRWIEMLGEEYPATAKLKKILRAEGYRLYGLSNWSAETFPQVEATYTFMKDLDGMVISGYEGVQKPDERIYRILLERYNLRPEETVFFDDNIDNVIGAREVGIHAILFRDAEQAERDLNTLIETLNE